MKKFIFQLLTDPKLYQYILVGGISALVDISLFLILRETIALHYLILATGSFVVATLVNFLLCNHFVFKQQQARSQEARFALTYLVSGVGLCIHHTCLFIAFELLALPMVLSKLFAMGVAFGWNFLSRKHFVFKTA
ncbi:MAG: GtrA family protein [Proteobacteria bacterium]|nr:GtrA family protein [Pseudomonadota bacterium]